MESKEFSINKQIATLQALYPTQDIASYINDELLPDLESIGARLIEFTGGEFQNQQWVWIFIIDGDANKVQEILDNETENQAYISHMDLLPMPGFNLPNAQIWTVVIG